MYGVYFHVMTRRNILHNTCSTTQTRVKHIETASYEDTIELHIHICLCWLYTSPGIVICHLIIDDATESSHDRSCPFCAKRSLADLAPHVRTYRLVEQFHS